jgi:hypothetical protein
VKASHAFELDLAYLRAARTVRRAMDGLGWEVVDEYADRLVGEEALTGASHVIWPVKAEISWVEISHTRMRIELDCTISGQGPLQSRDLVDRMRQLQGEIEQQARA